MNNKTYRINNGIHYLNIYGLYGPLEYKEEVHPLVHLYYKI